MIGLRRILWILAAGLLLTGGAVARDKGDMKAVAEGYVRLLLEIGLYEPGYVDAYFGPPGWKPAQDVAEETFPVERLAGRADALIGQLKGIDATRGTDLEKQRRAFLEKQLLAVRAKIDLISGKKLSFDDEAQADSTTLRSRALRRRISPIHSRSSMRPFPVQGDVYSRFNSYRIRFTIRRESLEKVLQAAVATYRRRTAGHVKLPAGERFEMRFVTDKPWGAAVTYKGRGASLVEVNGDVPFLPG